MFDVEMFSERLNSLRTDKGISRADMSKEIGIPISSLGNYERGDKLPSADTLKKICNYYNVSCDYLLGLTSHPNIIAKWPAAVPVGAVQSVDLIKNTVDSMISSVTLSNYGLKLFDCYAEIFNLLLEIDSFTVSKLHELQHDYPKFRQFGSEMEMMFDNTPILMALAAGYEEAVDFAKKLTKAEKEIENKVLEVAEKIKLILYDDVTSAIKGKDTKSIVDEGTSNDLKGEK